MASSVDETIMEQNREKPPAKTVKGVYLTAYSASREEKIKEIIALSDATELNAVIIDIKDYSGSVLYESSVPAVAALGTQKKRIHDLPALISLLHEHNMYVIARQTVFQDPLLAEKKPEWAVQQIGGGVWRDHKGLAWVDPSVTDVWNYNIAIAKEAVSLGFDEINFDYVRFPSDGDISTAVYHDETRPSYDVMGDFFFFLGQEMAEEPAWISVDMFGFVMERHDGMNIGQRLEDAVDSVDYISPMMYPSHYPAGHLGLDNPAAFPGEVIAHGMEQGMPYVAGKRAKIRPWIQAFHLGAIYGAENIRAQIDAVETATDAGWLLWNAANRYTDAGLKLEEVSL
ncbi:MAG: hypothetical protein A3G08_04015 [Candidatus Magasanikbacteria bacterium RIFCSPLOWO2_12_FULL_47_9b]|nr:MAG: hypothetical protein A3I74_04560 [Candidatus Magasanikbacteria bacterium RIFCSPLOWO2_02_FULL_47_16]OGH79518.1 MAG: hypothetical protein A3C10_01530 [Candidatus Magasanikbacteria bacterium RIFCSPHIGHO2_02_FULL_48_18]OGH83510.1 MAG: hypothetical protein A3G08_04015 [Candidatus Magasanikbacteria bacterium RIFCSPLOWO2_12_FULL_47_9b]